MKSIISVPRAETNMHPSESCRREPPPMTRPRPSASFLKSAEASAAAQRHRTGRMATSRAHVRLAASAPTSTVLARRATRMPRLSARAPTPRAGVFPTVLRLRASAAVPVARARPAARPNRPSAPSARSIPRVASPSSLAAPPRAGLSVPAAPPPTPEPPDPTTTTSPSPSGRSSRSRASATTNPPEPPQRRPNPNRTENARRARARGEVPVLSPPSAARSRRRRRRRRRGSRRECSPLAPPSSPSSPPPSSPRRTSSAPAPAWHLPSSRQSRPWCSSRTARPYPTRRRWWRRGYTRGR